MPGDMGKLTGWDVMAVNILAFAIMTKCQMFFLKNDCMGS